MGVLLAHGRAGTTLGLWLSQGQDPNLCWRDLERFQWHLRVCLPDRKAGNYQAACRALLIEHVFELPDPRAKSIILPGEFTHLVPHLARDPLQFLGHVFFQSLEVGGDGCINCQTSHGLEVVGHTVHDCVGDIRHNSFQVNRRRCRRVFRWRVYKKSFPGWRRHFWGQNRRGTVPQRNFRTCTWSTSLPRRRHLDLQWRLCEYVILRVQIEFTNRAIHKQSTSPVEHASQGGANLQFHASFQEKRFITPWLSFIRQEPFTDLFRKHYHLTTFLLFFSLLFLPFRVGPGTLFISHENAFFLFSVFRVVQGEAKTPKIMGCCRAIFAFLHDLKFGTFRGKWTLEWVFKTSHFFRLALYFFNQQ